MSYIRVLARTLFILVITTVFFCIGPLYGHAQNITTFDSTVDEIQYDQTPQEKILLMDVVLSVNTDNSVSVTERIVYDFGPEYKHGIYREIPLTTVVGALDRVVLQDIYVADERGTEYPFTMTKSSGRYTGRTIRIGDPDTTITGIHTYIITYTAHNAVGHFDDRDELYWNATGNDWTVPIEKATAHVLLPAVIDSSSLSIASYCGPMGAIDSCIEGNITPLPQQTQVDFEMPRNLSEAIGSGMTVAVGFPIGLVDRPNTSDVYWHWIVTHWFYPVPFVIALWWMRKPIAYWWHRRTFYKKNTVIAQYDAGDFTPLQVAGIMGGNIADKDLSAEIIYLATKGYVTITRTEGIYTFKSTDKSPNALSEYDKVLLRGIANKDENQLSNTLYAETMDIRLKAMSSLRGQYLEKEGKAVSSVGIAVLGIFLAVNPGVFIWLLAGFAWGYIWSGVCILMVIIMLCIRRKGGRLTDLGLEVERKFLGLKHYIKVAEEERIKFHTAPTKDPALFEALLPYAMVFGIEKEWAKQFEGMYITPPTWYTDTTMGAFSAIAFSSDMHHFASQTSRALFSVPQSSGSSGGFSSGSSGGGSSGGGGGGGGGGSW